MTTINKMVGSFKRAQPYFMLLLVAIFIASCDAALPEEGSIADATPPSADFVGEPNESNYKEISFVNLSASATDYAWDFGDGKTSTEKNPTHEYDTTGTYTVKLTATDKLAKSDVTTKTLEIVKPIVSFTPEILNPDFDVEGADAYRDNWRNGDLGGVIQITSSPTHSGAKAAKLPSAGDRIGYQLVTVQANKDYTISFYYTMKTTPAGSAMVSILNGHITDPTLVAGATIQSVTLTDQTDADTYVAGSVTFNSGASTEVAILFGNLDVETRFDTFTIVEN